MRIVDLVSTDTREGRVLKVLLDKLETIRRELRSDKVFDVIGRLFENRSLRGHMREALTDEGERRARRRLEAGLTSEVVRKTHRLDEQRYGRRGDVARRLGTLKHEMERERYLHLLPANVRRFVELASPLLGLAVRGELDGSFSLVPTRPGALDPLLAALETHPADARGRLRVRRPESGEVCVWMHPGEPVFDAMCDRVLAICGPEAARGAIFVDPRATEAYLMHLGDVAVEEEGRRAEDGGLLAKGGERYAEDAERKTLKRRLLALRQGEDGKVPEMSVEEVGLLRGVPDHPPGAVPLAARALTLRAEALGHLDAEARRGRGRAGLRSRTCPGRRGRAPRAFPTTPDSTSCRSPRTVAGATSRSRDARGAARSGWRRTNGGRRASWATSTGCTWSTGARPGSLN